MCYIGINGPTVVHNMTDYDNPKILCQPSNAKAYHTEECQKVTSSKHEVRHATQNVIEWHDLDECKYCSGEYEANGGGAVVKHHD